MRSVTCGRARPRSSTGPPHLAAQTLRPREHIVAALDRLFDRREGQALIRLMADGVAGAIKLLAQATQDWCDDIRAAIVVMLRADDPHEDPEVADAAASFLAPEFKHLAEELFTAALGRGLVRLPKIAFYLCPDREGAWSDLTTIAYGVVRVLDLQDACPLGSASCSGRDG